METNQQRGQTSRPSQRPELLAVLGSQRKMFVLSCVLILISSCALHAQTGWKLVWSDEFNGAPGALPDPANWKFETGSGATIAGNGEAETYCAYGSTSAPCAANLPNAYLDGKGHLVIVAIRSDRTLAIPGKNVVSPVYTSARLYSVKSFLYGRIEASIRVPSGCGVWPAFWAMGVHDSSLNWPANGEITLWNPGTLNQATAQSILF